MSQKFIFYLILIGLLIAIFETAGYLTRFIDDDMYDYRNQVLAEVDEAGLAEATRGGMDPVLGWRSYGPQVTDGNNCQGTRVEYAFDRLGARVYNGYDGASAEIIVVGDSYSQGYEVAGEDAYAARLSRILGISVANHGYGGYGPLQAFLSLKQNIIHYPQARIAILAIMYENIFRMMNSYRPLLITKGTTYALKPYMKAEDIQPHPGQKAFADVDTFKGYVNNAFDNDFWARPPQRFPFFVSLIQALRTDFFYFKKLPRKIRKIGFPEFALAYRSSKFSQELISLLSLYAEFAKKQDLVPVVVFIPRDKYDTRSPSRFIETNRQRLPGDLLIGDLGAAAIDWERYNLLDTKEADNVRFCHPSPYGHQKIADFIAELLKTPLPAPSGAHAPQSPNSGDTEEPRS
jgi:hypothetical protein